MQPVGCTQQTFSSSLQDVTFHQCVNLGRFNTEKVVSFVPPDGEFELMKYRCQEGISLPFKVRPGHCCCGQILLCYRILLCCRIAPASTGHHAAATDLLTQQPCPSPRDFLLPSESATPSKQPVLAPRRSRR